MRTFDLDFTFDLVESWRMGNSADAMRRWLGAFCLSIAFGLLIWGQTLLKPFLTGLLFIFYWLTCFVFTCSSIIIALLDVRAVRRRIQAEQRDLVQRTLNEAENKTEAADR